MHIQFLNILESPLKLRHVRGTGGEQGLTAGKEMYLQQFANVVRLLQTVKSSFYKNKPESASPRDMFLVVKGLSRSPHSKRGFRVGAQGMCASHR